jgi:ADP-heptose:LPS heptosyltransferase
MNGRPAIATVRASRFWARPGTADYWAALQPLPRDGIQRILLCRPNHRLGNLLFLTPLLTEIEACYPRATVDIVVAGGGMHALFSGFGNVGTVFELPRNGFHAPRRFGRVLRSVWREHYDLVIDPELRSRSTRFVVNLCSTTYRLGFIGAGNSARLTHGVPGSTCPRHMAKRAAYLLRSAVHGTNPEPDGCYPELDVRLSPEERVWGANALAIVLQQDSSSPRQPIIAIFADATGAKRYAVSWWREFTLRLRDLVPQSRFLEVLPPHAAPDSTSEFPTYQSSNIRQVAAVIGSTSLFVSADCGVMHLASASGMPLVFGLFSVTDESLYRPFGVGRHAIPTHDRTPADVAQIVGETFLAATECR